MYTLGRISMHFFGWGFKTQVNFELKHLLSKLTNNATPILEILFIGGRGDEKGLWGGGGPLVHLR